MRSSLPFLVVSGFLACGGGADGSPVAAPGAALASETTHEVREGQEPPGRSAGAEEAPRRSTAKQVPDPCQLLTADDASELLGEPVGAPQNPDAGGYPCVYRGESGKGQIILDMYLARGPTVEDGQLGINLEYCEGEAVAEPPGLGQRAALFHNRNESCGPDWLWVSTGVYLETELDAETGRRPEGFIQLSFTLDPAPDRDTLIAKLSTAAKRALARLPR